MATRSYFVLFAGVQAAQTFKPSLRLPAPGQLPLLTQQDLWEQCRQAPPSLIFRVRSESDPLADLASADKLESCVGVVDAITRWRVVFNMTRQLVTAIRQPALRQACTQAMTFVSSQHPASVSTEQRSAIIGELMKIVQEGSEGQPAPNAFEQRVGASVARLVGADNDVEAAHYVPFVEALCPFNQDTQRAEFGARMATIETLSGGVLLTEAATRLSERQPSWLFSAMPSLEAGTDEG